MARTAKRAPSSVPSGAPSDLVGLMAREDLMKRPSTVVGGPGPHGEYLAPRGVVSSQASSEATRPSTVASARTATSSLRRPPRGHAQRPHARDLALRAARSCTSGCRRIRRACRRLRSPPRRRRRRGRRAESRPSPRPSHAGGRRGRAGSGLRGPASGRPGRRRADADPGVGDRRLPVAGDAGSHPGPGPRAVDVGHGRLRSAPCGRSSGVCRHWSWLPKGRTVAVPASTELPDFPRPVLRLVVTTEAARAEQFRPVNQVRAGGARPTGPRVPAIRVVSPRATAATSPLERSASAKQQARQIGPVRGHGQGTRPGP